MATFEIQVKLTFSGVPGDDVAQASSYVLACLPRPGHVAGSIKVVGADVTYVRSEGDLNGEPKERGALLVTGDPDA